ncbi:MAG: enoyl-CoA hydratase/isomerase family protein [Chloracidobacterium sp.]|nr:enoyl-CoA hydratase/isomerase family protein [Chloracidobacterium sp.]
MSLITSTEGATRFLTLNRPEKRNALNDELVAALKAAFREADEDADLRAVVVHGAGKDFCSGADLSALQKIAGASYEENLEDAKSLAELFAMPRKMKVPVIAAVHGRALAGGCGLATACDIVLSTDTAVFGYPEVKIGFVPAIVAAFLRRNISEKRAFEILTRGFEFTAREANFLGLVNRIFPEEGFDAAVLEYASDYSKLSASAVQLTKRLLYRMDELGFDDSIEVGTEINAEARMTEDCQKGIAKFLEK